MSGSRIGREVIAWWTALVSDCPGAAGYRLRRWWFGRELAALGPGAVIGPHVLIHAPERIRIGRDFSCWRQTTLSASAGGDLQIGDRVSLNTNVLINAASGGRIVIGSDVLIGPNAVFRASDHAFATRTKPIREQGHTAGEIVVEDDVWIAANVTLVGGVRIGRGAVVAANAVVTRDVEPYSVVGGVPAAKIAMRAEP